MSRALAIGHGTQVFVPLIRPAIPTPPISAATTHTGVAAGRQERSATRDQKNGERSQDGEPAAEHEGEEQHEERESVQAESAPVGAAGHAERCRDDVPPGEQARDGRGHDHHRHRGEAQQRRDTDVGVRSRAEQQSAGRPHTQCIH
jgi:hypothetical protein